MKAAVLHQTGTIPRYEEYPTPQPQNDGQVLIQVQASSIKQLDRSKAAGTHYTTYATMPTVVGVDGAGVLADGTRVYAMGITGMMAEQALASAQSLVNLPYGLDMITAAALPNVLLGSDAALRYRARIQKGDTVLVNGATGITGKVAVQVAKILGADKVIATGRNEAMLKELKALGADETISLRRTDDEILSRLVDINTDHHINIVLDYLWGHPMTLILKALQVSKQGSTRVVTVGEMAGATIELPSGILRSSQIELLGSGIGSIPMNEIGAYMKNVMPEMLAAAAAGRLRIDTTVYPLKDIATAWQANNSGKRVVIEM